ncbi:hypothetical protein CHS0354_009738 [Potamilus streckersoni]|uniref:Uncharacterized protein n=1 Tax=Potamilus streckersoni TaxID=2493646 RepID=A0AAE0VM74_9BIVA|nr:hypothetical protein CHS0354_009738 [Potamilus streckersoni]
MGNTIFRLQQQNKCLTDAAYEAGDGQECQVTSNKPSEKLIGSQFSMCFTVQHVSQQYAVQFSMCFTVQHDSQLSMRFTVQHELHNSAHLQLSMWFTVQHVLHISA